MVPGKRLATGIAGCVMKVIFLAALGLPLGLSATTAEAKHHNTIKTVTGCVEGTSGHYELSAVTKKGKHHEYALVGDRDFSAQVGHKVQARGAVTKGSLKVSSMKDLGGGCH